MLQSLPKSFRPAWSLPLSNDRSKTAILQHGGKTPLQGRQALSSSFRIVLLSPFSHLLPVIIFVLLFPVHYMHCRKRRCNPWLPGVWYRYFFQTSAHTTTLRRILGLPFRAIKCHVQYYLTYNSPNQDSLKSLAPRRLTYAFFVNTCFITPHRVPQRPVPQYHKGSDKGECHNR